MSQPTPIAADDFETKWLPYVRKIFTGADPTSGLFTNTGWIAALLPGGLVLDEDQFAALGIAARDAGDSSAVITAYPPPGERYRLDWDRAGFEFVWSETELGHIEAITFGASATWGLFTSPETFAVLGGSPAFMTRFLHAAGGSAAVEERFRQAAAEGLIGYGTKGEHYVDALLKAIGWHLPSR